MLFVYSGLFCKLFEDQYNFMYVWYQAVLGKRSREYRYDYSI